MRGEGEGEEEREVVEERRKGRERGRGQLQRTNYHTYTVVTFGSDHHGNRHMESIGVNHRT